MYSDLGFHPLHTDRKIAQISSLKSTIITSCNIAQSAHRIVQVPFTTPGMSWISSNIRALFTRHTNLFKVFKLFQIKTMGYDDCFIGKCPDKVLLLILGYIPHKSLISTCSRVCKKWKTLTQDSRLWSFVSLRPEVSGIYIPSIEFLVQLIRNR